MVNYKKVPLLAVTFLILSSAFAQEVTGRGNKNTNGVDTMLLIPTSAVVNGDSMRVKVLQPVEVYTLRTFDNKKHQKKYDKLVRNVKKVYPYSKMVGERMIQYNEAMQNLTRKERKRLVKSFEKEAKEKYGPELARLTPNQGRILLKLIDRETQYTPYELVEELRGSIQAFFYNMMAGMFGFDLKEKFDPANKMEDQYIDEICALIERGQL